MKMLLSVVVVFIVASGSASAIDDALCTSDNEGEFFDNPASCAAYFVCTPDGFREGTCPIDEGLHFNEESQLCEPPFGCIDPFRCPETGAGTFPIINSCTDFRVCSNGLETNRTCPTGLHFDVALGVCNVPEEARCRRELCPSDRDQTELLIIASPHNCYDFYVCNEDEPKRFTCPYYLHFNEALGNCDFPDQANCHLYAPTLPECTPGLEIEFIPFEDDCNRYWICINGTPEQHSCPPGLHFDFENEVCRDPEDAGCITN